MAKITNMSRNTMSFVVKGEAKDGVPPMDSILAGESKSLDVDIKSAQIVGALAVGAITIGNAKPEQPAPAAKLDKPA